MLLLLPTSHNQARIISLLALRGIAIGRVFSLSLILILLICQNTKSKISYCQLIYFLLLFGNPSTMGGFIFDKTKRGGKESMILIYFLLSKTRRHTLNVFLFFLLALGKIERGSLSTRLFKVDYFLLGKYLY